MSRKSRRPEPEGAAGGKKKRGRRGRKGEPEVARAHLVVDPGPQGVPFAVVVVVAALMSLPTVSMYMSGGLRFDAMMVRVLAALAVSWLLSNLVYAVFDSMRPKEVKAVVELPPEQAFDVMTGQTPNPLTGTVVGDDLPVRDPYALDPVEPPAPIPPVDSVGPVEEPPAAGEKGSPAA
ncbi:hypothetical protein SAMN05421595_0278 [Austwickia chelonae]|uniref:Uncharacterized protein n=1 Tax=Austwickia chelonae NBRC 105200 TaxID=1184607 RepID=K6UM38_9MICO|nr:hypothetical protein [Austwickia chelonae]GAB77776.1 hypothetical protein AUCHE_08_00150 [Austwickia chelonae NBRC 105200]SEV89274.1 hypothetical protein SAMN05421595_0278 [Austwickia chelonae]